MLNFINNILVESTGLVGKVYAAGSTDWSGIAGGVEGFFNGFYESAQSVLNTLGIVALIFCGGMYMFSTDPQTARMAKSWALRIGVGLIIVNAAPKIIEAFSALADAVNL